MLLFNLLVASVVTYTVVSERGIRVKRRLVFTKNSKLYFRLNAKENVIPWNQVFAHGWGFRLNWDLPEKFPTRVGFFKRSIRSDLQNLENIQAKIGYSCILKSICDTVTHISLSNNCGIFCEIGKFVSESIEEDAQFLKDLMNNCKEYTDLCQDSVEQCYNIRD